MVGCALVASEDTSATIEQQRSTGYHEEAEGAHVLRVLKDTTSPNGSKRKLFHLFHHHSLLLALSFAQVRLHLQPSQIPFQTQVRSKF